MNPIADDVELIEASALALYRGSEAALLEQLPNRPRTFDVTRLLDFYTPSLAFALRDDLLDSHRDDPAATPSAYVLDIATSSFHVISSDRAVLYVCGRPRRITHHADVMLTQPIGRRIDMLRLPRGWRIALTFPSGRACGKAPTQPELQVEIGAIVPE